MADPIVVSSLLSLGKDLISRIWKDPNKQAEQLQKLAELEQSENLAKLQAYINVLQGRMSIVAAEAKSEHWLTATWRPITMLVFVTIIVARFFGFGAEDMTDAEYEKLWELLKIGIGGYISSRGIEKVIKTYKGN